MTDPTLYAWYSAEEATALFGAPDDAERLCDGQWVIFPTTAICLTAIGEKWEASHFHDASSFYWVAKKAYGVSDGPSAKFLPKSVGDGSYQNYWIRLFVRPAQAEKYLYAGEMAMGHHLIFESSDADRGAAHFKLTPVLPSKVLAELGGLRLGEMDVVALDEALDRLKQPTTVRDRLDILRQVVNFWHGPIKPEDGMSGVEQVGGVPLPLPLQFWYGWAGKRTEVMSGQNCLRHAITGTGAVSSESRMAACIFMSRTRASMNGRRCLRAKIHRSSDVMTAKVNGSMRRSGCPST
jgi:hypothetical protein